jgi:hypothetical protein
MKTTIELPDRLLIEAKKRAAEQRRPLRALFVEALREHLDRGKGAERPPRKIRWVTVSGGLPPGLDLSDRARTQEWIRRQR